jgi:MYXO-CTERM domain-containing protein
MQKTTRAASRALGTFALAGFCASAHATWVLSNDSGGDGSISGAYPVFAITGSNNGDPDTGGFDNTTFYLQTFAASESISFTWAFSSVDTAGTIYDQGGWILNGTETQLSILYDTDTTSTGQVVNLIVSEGSTFGFYVHSADSLGGAGTLFINEDAPPPPPPPAIPEPQTAALMLAGLAALFAAARRRKNS